MSAASDALRGLFDRLVARKVVEWSSSSSSEATDTKITTLDKADIITSKYKPSEAEAHKHALVLDIDHPSWLVKSSTEGHYHLYVEVPGGIPDEDYGPLLWALANAGVIEKGYAAASIDRGFTAARPPWVKKGDG